MFLVKRPVFPSGKGLGSEVVRMHELHACEIPLLWDARSSLWSATPTVCVLQAYVDNSSQEARAAAPPGHTYYPPPRLRGRVQRSRVQLWETVT